MGRPVGSGAVKIALSMYPGLERRALRPEHREVLAGLGDVLDPTAVNSLSAARADEVLGEADVLLAHWGCLPVDAAFLARAPRLRMVAYAAGTVKDSIAPEVFDRGILVTSGAAANAVPVAEFTLAAVLFAGKDVFGARERLRADADPQRPWPTRRRPVGNLAKRVGLIGASHVGRTVIELLRPFRLEVLLADPYVDEGAAATLGVRLVELDELLATSDVVSIHAPALPETRHLIGAPELARMDDGATLVNTARGSLLDHDALVAELRTGRLHAVLDVTDPEPLPDDHELLRLPNAFVTPHLAGSQGTELNRMAELVLEEIRRFGAGEPPLHPVTGTDLGRIA
jgi:phosphoglycerate dehydrogenase-like enzyme